MSRPIAPGYTRRKSRSTAAILSALALAAAPILVQATEEPDYQVVRRYPQFEVREYSGYAVAEVVVPGPAGEAGNRAFPILAGYIFGKNKGQRTFAMTAPVKQEPTPTRLPMTAPVSQAATPGGYQVQFVLPKGITAAVAPEPLDARVRLRDIPASRVAVIRYAGFWSDANYEEHLATLRAALRAASLDPVGEPVYSRYNPPFTPWFLRRNEIWLPLDRTP